MNSSEPCLRRYQQRIDFTDIYLYSRMRFGLTRRDPGCLFAWTGEEIRQIKKISLNSQLTAKLLMNNTLNFRRSSGSATISIMQGHIKITYCSNGTDLRDGKKIGMEGLSFNIDQRIFFNSIVHGSEILAVDRHPGDLAGSSRIVLRLDHERIAHNKGFF